MLRLGGQFHKSRSLLKLSELTGRFSFLFEQKRVLFGILAGLAIILMFRHYIRDIVIILVLGLVAVLSTMYKRYMRAPPAVELITFSTVMIGIAYGPLHGAIFGAVTTLVAEILNSCLDAFIVGYIPARAVVGFVSAFFPTAGIVPLGLAMSILYNAIAQPLYAFQSDAELRMKLLAFVLINVPFNFLVFSFLGEFVKRLVV